MCENIFKLFSPKYLWIFSLFLGRWLGRLGGLKVLSIWILRESISTARLTDTGEFQKA